MLTMVLGGLWHGASWNFVIWGALHGVALAVDAHVAAAARIGRREAGERLRRGRLDVFCTFHFVCFAWIFFRAPTFAHAKLVIHQITSAPWGTANLSPRVLGVLLLALIVHFLPKELVLRARDVFVRAPAFVQGLTLAGVAFCLHAVAGAKAEPFVYGQF